MGEAENTEQETELWVRLGKLAVQKENLLAELQGVNQQLTQIYAQINRVQFGRAEQLKQEKQGVDNGISQ